MKNRIFDCIDGRFSSARLSGRERRLLAKIESGLRNRTDDYRFAEGPYRPTPRVRISPPPRPGSNRRSPLDAFLERRPTLAEGRLRRSADGRTPDSRRPTLHP